MTRTARREAALEAAFTRTEEATEPLLNRVRVLAERDEDWNLEDIAEALAHFDNVCAPFAKGVFTRAMTKAIFAKGLRPVRHEWHVTERNFEGKRLDQLMVWFAFGDTEAALVCTAKDRTCGPFGLFEDGAKNLRNALGWRSY